MSWYRSWRISAICRRISSISFSSRSPPLDPHARSRLGLQGLAHDAADLAVVEIRGDVVPGDDPDQPPVAVDHEQAADLGVGEGLGYLGERGVGPDRHRIARH